MVGQIKKRNFGHEWGSKPYFFGPFHEYREKMLIRVLRRHFTLSEGSVLDAGCGSGSMAIKLARMGFKVTAIDRSARFIRFVKKRAAENHLSNNINLVVSELSKASLPGGGFDLIYAGEVLEHLDDDKKAGHFPKLSRDGPKWM